MSYGLNTLRVSQSFPHPVPNHLRRFCHPKDLVWDVFQGFRSRASGLGSRAVPSLNPRLGSKQPNEGALNLITTSRTFSPLLVFKLHCNEHYEGYTGHDLLRICLMKMLVKLLKKATQ